MDIRPEGGCNQQDKGDESGELFKSNPAHFFAAIFIAMEDSLHYENI
jgi:hypothetical protein